MPGWHIYYHPPPPPPISHFVKRLSVTKTDTGVNHCDNCTASLSSVTSLPCVNLGVEFHNSYLQQRDAINGIYFQEI